MKDYLTIEKSISEIINKLNKLKKTAKEVCIKFSVTRKKGNTKRQNKNMSKAKNTKNSMNTNSSKGSQYNSYKSIKSMPVKSTPLIDSNAESPINVEPEPISIEATPTPVKI